MYVIFTVKNVPFKV